MEELSQIRLVEIISDNDDWSSETITFNKFIANSTDGIIFNPQPIYDLKIPDTKNHKLYFTVSKYVINRIINGKSKGLALEALGPIIVNLSKLPIIHLNN